MPGPVNNITLVYVLTKLQSGADTDKETVLRALNGNLGCCRSVCLPIARPPRSLRPFSQ